MMICYGCIYSEIEESDDILVISCAGGAAAGGDVSGFS